MELSKLSKNDSKNILILVSFLVLLIVSFFLGRLSTGIQTQDDSDIQIISSTAILMNQSQPKIQTSQNTQESSELSEKTLPQIRASSRGSKYYLPWCKSTFSPENTVYFDSEEEAQKAGYEKATNCLSSP